jgi:hypothetical protein
MAYVAVDSNGDAGIGSAFHVGDGVFVTARHVVEGRIITEVRVTDEHLYYRSSLYPKNEKGSYLITPDSPRICTDVQGRLAVASGPFFHPDPDVDLAAFIASGIAEGAHYVPLGGHLDDWIGIGDFVLSRAIVLGYPPVPFTTEPALIAAACEVNSVVDLRIGKKSQPHFILSAIPRGGFSGGLAFSEWGFAIGVITQSLLNGGGAPETGYFTITSIEAVYECLQAHEICPQSQIECFNIE